MVWRDRQRTSLKLADCYIVAGREDKAISIYNRLKHSDDVLGGVSGPLTAYIHLKLGLAHADGNPKMSAEFFRSLYEGPYKNLPWAAEGILYLGILTFNTTQDPAQALPHYEYVVRNFPNHPQALRALYFCCLNARRLNDKQKLKVYSTMFLQKYPDDRWIPEIKELLEYAVR